MRKLILGQGWWGLDARTMAVSVPDATGFNLWDLSSRVDRVLMGSPLEFHISGRRLRRLINHEEMDWTIVVSPHRLDGRMAEHIRARTKKLVGLLGDDPIGRRRIHSEVAEYFDSFIVADDNWVNSLPAAFQGAQTLNWGSAGIHHAFANAKPYSPKRVALIGTPYEERVELARLLADKLPILTFGKWPQIPNAVQYPGLNRIETLRAVRAQQALVVNAHHPQFHSGFNPQYSDYVVSRVPQLLKWSHQDGVKTPGQSGDTIQLDQILKDARVENSNLELFSRPIEEFLFSETIKKALTS